MVLLPREQKGREGPDDRQQEVAELRAGVAGQRTVGADGRGGGGADWAAGATGSGAAEAAVRRFPGHRRIAGAA